ncbi:MAG TPA: EamA family transporter RarD [Nocardioides sp.]|jgi:chloramphenicol-sensitive protein RarD|uniref:EamA family transporter RarD n=1 Tax=Nocardioides sp. TaxID=35761 RepID=UPI002E2FF3E8|nr:EamA family transporter RarD [Nocardioides sp.]HEX3932987.1 EamA family transporter RarD [Nocardioides sp.]
MGEERRGFLLGVTAYLLWGLFPLYWPLLEPAGALEILAHRIFWSLVAMGILVLALRRTSTLRAIATDRRVASLLALAAVLVTVNWATYIWAVNNGHVVESSLGYFINPLVTVLMGVFILGEQLRSWQWVAMGVAGLAVVALTLDYGRLPWVALVLACSFGSYGLCKKKANAPAIESLTFETLVIGPVALAYLVWLTARGQSTFTSHGPGHLLLFLSTGLITAVPLVCFGGAAIRVPMTTLGLLQYLAPILQFALGIIYFHEDMPIGRWLGFGLVWVALAIFTVDSLRHRRRPSQLVELALPVR